MKQKQAVIIFVLIAGVVLTIALGCGHNRNVLSKSSVPDPVLLQAAIRSSDMVRIYDAELQKVLFESRDVEDIQWLGEAFVADASSPCLRLQSKMRYRLLFYDNSKITAEIGFKQSVTFYWIDAAWDYNADFILRSKSYSEVLPWLCEKSGKDLNELFPATDWVKGLRERPKNFRIWDEPGKKGQPAHCVIPMIDSL